MRISCSGSGPYTGVGQPLASRFKATKDGTIAGALSGTMKKQS